MADIKKIYFAGVIDGQKISHVFVVQLETFFHHFTTESVNSIKRFPLAMAILNFLSATQFMTQIREQMFDPEIS